MENRYGKNQILYDAAVLMAFIYGFGFPGRLTLVLGHFVETVMNYGCFFLEVTVMLVSSAEHFMEIKLLDLKRKYLGIYLIIATFTICSIIGTHDLKGTVITLLHLIGTILFVLWICDHYSIYEILHLACIAQSIIIMITFVFMTLWNGLAYRTYNGERSLLGLMEAKNVAASEYGFGILLFILYAYFANKENRNISKIYFPIMLLQFFMLMKSNGTGAALAIILVILFLLFSYKGNNKFYMIPLDLLYIGGNVLFLLMALTIMPLFQGFFEMLGKDATLTGRIPLWEQIIEVMKHNHTFWGYGYATAWKNQSLVKLIHAGFNDGFFNTMTSGSHNVLMELWMTVGLLGVAALFMGMIICLNKQKELSSEQYIFCSSILLFNFISSLTERFFGSAYLFDTMFFFMSLGIACMRKERKKVDSSS